jgi:hypothetical protein
MSVVVQSRIRGHDRPVKGLVDIARTYGLLGARAALFSGVSVENVLSTRKVFVSCIYIEC